VLFFVDYHKNIRSMGNKILYNHYNMLSIYTKRLQRNRNQLLWNETFAFDRLGQKHIIVE
jgi:hypothetical protein